MTTTTSISLEFGMPVSPMKFGVEPMKWLMTKLDVSEIHSRRNEWEVNDFNLNNLYILKSISGRFLYLSHDLYEFMCVIYSLFIILFIYIWTSVYTCTYLQIYTQNICILQYLFVPRCSESRYRNVPLQNQAHFVEAFKQKSWTIEQKELVWQSDCFIVHLFPCKIAPPSQRDMSSTEWITRPASLLFFWVAICGRGAPRPWHLDHWHTLAHTST